MALTRQNTNNTNTRPETNYDKNIANGVQYETQAEAVEANAKAYAKRDWNTMQSVLQELGATSPEQIKRFATALLTVKRNNILNSIKVREDEEEANSDLPF